LVEHVILSITSPTDHLHSKLDANRIYLPYKPRNRSAQLYWKHLINIREPIGPIKYKYINIY